MRRKHRQQEEAEVNLTPLLDIVFIMLIFFIVTATFVKEQGLDIRKPDSTSNNPPPSDDENRAVVLEINSSGRIFVAEDDREIDVGAVGANVSRLKAARPQAAIIIRPHPDANTDVLVGVMNAVEKAGFGDYQVSPAN